MSTPHAPEAVTYYLDQAHRAQCVGARSAAVAMFRAALEQLLFEQGFKVGMLGKQIDDLVAAIGAGAAPKWARELDPAFLKVIKDLGNTAIHKNDGDISEQTKLDADLVAEVEALFAELLLDVYEREQAKRERLSRLESATKKKLTPPPKPG